MDQVNPGLRPIVYYATNHDWFAYQHFYQGLARTFGRDRVVLYIGPAVPWPPRKGGLAAGLSQVADNIWLLRPRILVGTSRRRLRRVRDRLVALQVARALRKLGVAKNDVLVWAYTADAVAFMQATPAARSVYWTGDEVVDPREAQLVQLVDHVLAVSAAAFEEKRELVGERVSMVPMAIDPGPFERAARNGVVPDDLQSLPRPIFGYGGAVNQRIDWDLLRDLAKGGGGSVVVVGPAMDAVGAEQQNMAQPGLYFLGHRDAEEAPSYVAAFDVALVPYRLTKFNLGSNPVKTYEYLAAGVPVVATDLPSLHGLEGVVEVAGSREEFIAMAQRLAAAPKSSAAATARRDVAAGYSYDALVARLEQLLGDDLRRR